MKIEKVIKQLESILDHTRSMAASPDADNIWRKDIDALEFALTALRSMSESGEYHFRDDTKLSLEQLKQMDGKPVWCECLLEEDRKDQDGEWFIVVKEEENKYGFELKKPLDFGCLICKNENYGTDWLAYSYPPAHIDRSKWVSVKERLPDDEKDGEMVLAVASGKPHENITLLYAPVMAGYFPGEGWVVNEYPEWENPIITHWMPLPEPPEED